jgi:hypothetical protein
MKKVIFSLVLGMSAMAQAQSYVHQVYVLNEGNFDYVTNTQIVPVTLGTYNPQTQVYSVLDTLENMRFASDLVISGEYFYVAADAKILKYSKLTNQLITEVSCPGVRNLGVYQNKLVATRGEYLSTFNSYLHIYNTTDLSLIAAIDSVAGPKWATQNIVIDGSTAYIAVNNGYEWGNEKGLIGSLNLTNLTYGNEVDLGVNGKNPDNLVKIGNYIVAVNNKDWSGSSISRIDLSNNSVITENLSLASTGCGTSCLRDGNISYQIAYDISVNEWNVLTMNNVGPVANLAMSYYELAEDETNNLLYASNTDYTSYGKVYVYDQSNNEVTNFDVGVAPGTIVFDVRSTLGVTDLTTDFKVMPNPTAGKTTVSGNYTGELHVLNNLGQVVLTTNMNLKTTMDVSALEQGTYFIKFVASPASSTIKLIVE